MKGSKDPYYSLESNKVLSHKIGSLDQPMTSSKNEKPTPIMMLSTRTVTEHKFCSSRYMFYTIYNLGTDQA